MENIASLLLWPISKEKEELKTECKQLWLSNSIFPQLSSLVTFFFSRVRNSNEQQQRERAMKEELKRFLFETVAGSVGALSHS